MKSRHEVMSAITDELEAHNVPYKVEFGKKHAKIRFMFGGMSRTLVAGLSNKKQSRLVHNTRANVRRILLDRLPATGTSGR
jgi:hypothetical protein